MQNRAIRQDSLREWLSNKCTVQHLVSNLIKIEELDVNDSHFQHNLLKLKTANEQRIKIMNKYLPDLKSTEITGGGENGEVQITEIIRTIVNQPELKVVKSIESKSA